ncbi:MAG: ABC transporter permease [Bacteroidota bacterium]
MPPRFHLDTAIAAWRGSLTHNPAFSAADLDELERHLRDQTAALVANGVDEAEAFHRAQKELGAFGAVETEYRKVFWRKQQREGTLREAVAARLALGQSHLRVALRTLRTQSGYSAIHLAGLTVGLTCVLLIAAFVRFERSYDTFHTHAADLVRIVKEEPGSPDYFGQNHYAVTPGPLVEALPATFPEVIDAVQVYPMEAALGQEGALRYEEGMLATQAFFQLFSFQLLRGDPQTALAEPGSIVLTQNLATQLFGDADPLGQTLSYVQRRNQGELIVTGVVDDPPPNSHIQFQYLVSIVTLESYRDDVTGPEWDSSNYYTYVRLQPGADRAALADKLVALAREKLAGLPFYAENPERISIYYAQPFTDLYLHSHLNFELGPRGSLRYLYLFSAIGLLILLLAGINYVNLATAQALTRVRELGVRKVMGAHRVELALQFMAEGVLLALLAFGLSVVLVLALQPVVQAITGQPFLLGATPGFWLSGLGLAVLVGVLAGAYPALRLTQSNVVSAMKGHGDPRLGRQGLRNALVVTQFAITAVLLVGTLVLHRQVDFLTTSATGIDRDHVVAIRLDDRAARAQYPALKEALLAHPGVQGVTAARSHPNRITGQSTVRTWEGLPDENPVAVYNMPVQEGFVDLLDLDLVAGRAFTGERSTDAAEGVLVNETLVRQVGWTEPLGKTFEMHGRPMQVIGVMKDYHFLSFRYPIGPLALYQDRSWFTQVLVKVSPQQLPAVLDHMEATVNTFSPAFPFSYSFLDETYERVYTSEAQLQRLFTVFTGLALVIACLGLLGLTAFMVARRTREIGVRKVLGASVTSIVQLLSVDLLKLVGVAVLLAAPLAYLAVQAWLQEYAYHAPLTPWVFALSAAALLVTALLTVSIQSLRAASADPVKSLRVD